MDLLESRNAVLDWLAERKIPYEFYQHERAHTIDDCLRMPFISEDVTICKNIVLCNRQMTQFYLLLLKPLTPFRTSVVSKMLGSSRLSFAPETVLMEKLHLTSGSVSPLGLIFDRQNEIPLCYEEDILKTPKIAFHPCDNTSTVIFLQNVFWQQVIPALSHRTIPLNLSLSCQML